MSLAVPTSAEFPVLAREGLVYLDTAATSQTVRPALEAMERYYETYRASIHRGVYPLAAEATEAYEGARDRVAAFTGSTPGETVFTRNATEAINLVAGAWGRANVGTDDLVVLDRRWSTTRTSSRGSCSAAGSRTSRSPTTACSTSTRSTRCSSSARSWSRSRTSPTCSARSTRSPRSRAARTPPARVVLVDGAQAVPHLPVDVAELDADFYAWTGHKAYGPTGIGVLHGRRELLETMPPFLGGGHMIARVGDFESTWAEPPAKFEAGTMPVAEAIGLGAAVDWLAGVGMDAVREHGRDVTGYALERLAEVDGPDDPRHDRHRRARLAGELRARRRAPARRGRDPRPRGRVRPRRPPLRAAADAPARLAGLDARVVRGAHDARGRRPADRRLRQRPEDLRLMDDLYREQILEHYKRPHHWGELENPDLEFFDTNPLCGDELKVQMRIEDGKVADVAFSGHGCAISQAAASMTSDELIGMPVDKLLAARSRVRARAARDRHLGDAPEVRAALVEGHQVRGPGARGELGDRSGLAPSAVLLRHHARLRLERRPRRPLGREHGTLGQLRRSGSPWDCAASGRSLARRGAAERPAALAAATIGGRRRGRRNVTNGGRPCTSREGSCERGRVSEVRS